MPEREGEHPGEWPYSPPGPVSMDGDRAEARIRADDIQHAGADRPEDPTAIRGSNGRSSAHASDPDTDDARTDEELDGDGRHLVPVRQALPEPVMQHDEPGAERRRARKQPGDADVPPLHGVQAQQRADDEEADFNPGPGRSSRPPGGRHSPIMPQDLAAGQTRPRTPLRA